MPRRGGSGVEPRERKEGSGEGQSKEAEGAFVQFACGHRASLDTAYANANQCALCFDMNRLCAEHLLFSEPVDRAEATRQEHVRRAVETAVAARFGIARPTEWFGQASRAEVAEEVAITGRALGLVNTAKERAAMYRAREKQGPPSTLSAERGKRTRRVPLGQAIIENALAELGPDAAPIALPDGAATPDDDRAAAAIVEFIQGDRALSAATSARSPPRVFVREGRSFAEAVLWRHDDPALFFSDGWSLAECVTSGLLKNVSDLRCFPKVGPSGDHMSRSGICAHLSGAVEPIYEHLGPEEAKNIFFDVLESDVVLLASAYLTAKELRLVASPHLVASLLRDDLNGATLESFGYLTSEEFLEWGFTFELIKLSLKEVDADGRETTGADIEAEAEATARRNGRAEAFVRDRLQWPRAAVDELVVVGIGGKGDESDEDSEGAPRVLSAAARRTRKFARRTLAVDEELTKQAPVVSPAAQRSASLGPRRSAEPYFDESVLLESYDEVF